MTLMCLSLCNRCMALLLCPAWTEEGRCLHSASSASTAQWTWMATPKTLPLCPQTSPRYSFWTIPQEHTGATQVSSGGSTHDVCVRNECNAHVPEPCCMDDDCVCAFSREGEGERAAVNVVCLFLHLGSFKSVQKWLKINDWYTMRNQTCLYSYTLSIVIIRMWYCIHIHTNWNRRFHAIWHSDTDLLW